MTILAAANGAKPVRKSTPVAKAAPPAETPATAAAAPGEKPATAEAAPATKPWGQVVSYVRAPDGCLIELCTPVGG